MVCLWWSVLICITIAATSIFATSPPRFDLSIVQRQSSTASSSLHRRSNPAVSEIVIEDVVIAAEAQVGTPPQALTFMVATGTGDSLVLSVNAQQCQSANNSCSFGVYDPSQSSSYSRLSQNLNISYVDETGAQGEYFTDDIVLANTKIEALQIGLVDAGTVTENILGLGPPGLEVVPNSYTNLPYRIYSNGTVNIVGYSMWFESEDYLATGKLAFGGVDTKKFNGTLETLPMVTTDPTYKFVAVGVSGVSVKINGNAFSLTDSSANYSIDSGTTLSYLPTGVVDQLRTQLGFVYSQPGDENVQLLSEMKNATIVGFAFGASTIEISVRDLARPLNATHARIAINAATGSSDNVLGLSFLRKAYLVVDYTHNQVSLGQTVYNNASDLTFINANGTYGLSSTVNPEDTSTADTADGPPSAKNEGSSSTKIGIGVGVGLGVPALIAIAVGTFLLFRRRKRAKAAAENAKTSSLDHERVNQYGKAELSGIGNGPHREKAELDATRERRELEANSKRPVAELAGSSPQPEELAGGTSARGGSQS